MATSVLVIKLSRRDILGRKWLVRPGKTLPLDEYFLDPADNASLDPLSRARRKALTGTSRSED